MREEESRAAARQACASVARGLRAHLKNHQCFSNPEEVPDHAGAVLRCSNVRWFCVAGSVQLLARSGELEAVMDCSGLTGGVAVVRIPVLSSCACR